MLGAGLKAKLMNSEGGDYMKRSSRIMKPNSKYK